MLQHLNIQNFTLISQLDLEFQTGMTVLTGETGAGKSILIDALLLALGDRADARLIQPEQTRCNVSATFDISHLSHVQSWLSTHELLSENECVMRRTLTSDGRSRAFINGQTVPVQQLKELGQLLVSIHGQHEHQTLLKNEKQRALLDAYAGHIELLKNVESLYNTWQKAQHQLTLLKTQREQRLARRELLHFQVEALDQLKLEENEIPALDQEQKQLSHAEELLKQSQTLLEILSENNDVNALQLLNNAQTKVTQLIKIDPRLQTLSELLNNASIQIEEAVNELQSYLNKVELNPERLMWIENRITQIHDLARKHRVLPQELMPLQQQLTHELTQLDQDETQIDQLEKQIQTLAKDYSETAQKLSESRKKSAKKLGAEIEKIIHQLNMTGGKFKIEFQPYPDNQFSAQGLEKIEFFVSANPGQPLQPLSKVVSGGELSRISLAIHVLTAEKEKTLKAVGFLARRSEDERAECTFESMSTRDELQQRQKFKCEERMPVLIFDEVDVGVGGGTAEIIGKLLRKLSEATQVFCVTHLAQVAAQGHHHLRVNKITDKKSTQTSVESLDSKTRPQEIARMLGGVKLTSQTLAHAQEMLEEVT